MEKKYSRWQRFKIRWSGSIFVEYRKHEDWSGYLPFYAFRCDANEEHGIVESYPKGYARRLTCPKCKEDKKKEDEQKTPD